MKKVVDLLPTSIKNSYMEGSDRSKTAVKNIALSLGTRIFSILVGFLLVPMTINYVNPTQYGIWLTLSSVIGWIAYMNLGLGHGFRNRFAESKAKGDLLTARIYLSTTYFAISCLVIVLLFVALVANYFIDWADLLHLDIEYSHELKRVFVILCVFFCFNMIVNIFESLMLADQKPGLSSLVHLAGQVFSLFAIYILTKCTEGSLTNLAIFYSSIPGIVMLISSLIAFKFTNYKQYAPSIRLVKPKYIWNILNLGIQFFLINIFLILIFQISNLIITRELGAEMATTYNIAYRYFYFIYQLSFIIITPFWSAFTDAHTKNDILWMKSALRRLEKYWLVSIIGGLVMLALSSWFYSVWIGEVVQVPFMLSVSVLIYILVQCISCTYMNLINGVGTIRLQLIIYALSAIVSWPALTFLCKRFGIYGVTVFPTLVYIMQAVLGKIQLKKILSGEAVGIWSK